MTLVEELRATAQYTGLDGVKELLERAAAALACKDDALSAFINQYGDPDVQKWMVVRALARAALASQGEQA